MATRLEHANIAVRDVEEMIRFLQLAFPDFEIRGEGKTLLGRHWVHVGNSETYIAVNEAAQDPEPKRAPYSEISGMNHLGYEVSDVEALRERMLAAGYQESTVPNAHPERKRIYFYDREGKDWEFVEYKSTDPALRNDYTIEGN
ncbi:MAG: VOC family protein [Deltaproteobacteria bacterium]|nr:VOC family protein [Deltaproteobacteria bacterium]MBW2724086.1 VOC family protein [Deltaproteobacteria bacterium]